MRPTCLLVFATACALGALAQDDFDQFNEPPKKPGERPSDNIALGASYTFEPAPNYRHCTDPDDKKQLTDGVYSEGYFWVQPSTVGWQNAKPVLITLDLGEVKPIRGVSFHTAAGRAGVAWPAAIAVFVSDDGQQFYEACELVALSAKHGFPEPGEYTTHRYWTDELETHGRYVCFVPHMQPYAFVDEIEVYAGDADWLAAPMAGEPIADVKAHTNIMALLGAVQQRFRRDVQAVRALTDRPQTPRSLHREIYKELGAISDEVKRLRSEGFGEGFRTILPFNALHERVFKVRAQLWRAEKRRPLTVWQSGLWDALDVMADPPKESEPHVRVHMMLNEHRAGAFNISNAAEEKAVVELDIAGMPGGLNPEYVTVHEVTWTDTNEGIPVAAALPEATREGNAYVISVPSGMTRQVWLTFHPVDVEPGEHHGAIQLKSDEVRLDVPLTLTLAPLRFPDKLALHLGGWDYTNAVGNREVTAENREALIAHLRERLVDSPWATNAVIPRGGYDDAGAMTTEPDTSAFDAWLDLWPDAAQYCVFAAVGGSFDKWKTGTPEFDAGVQAWTRFWAGHAKKKGLEPEQLAWLIVDEPHALEQDAVILAWAKAIRAADTGIRVWEDPVYGDMSKANQDMVAACHVLCPNRIIFLRARQSYRDYFVEQRNRGIALEFYSCSGPARLLDPYAYYRLQAWTCWRYGAQAMHFWAFSDASGASSWNEYLVKRNAYTPLFLDATTVVAGKQMEACREGVEDYEYFVMLREAIDQAAQRGADDALLERARALLTQRPAEVCEAGKSTTMRWHNADVDRAVADQARTEVLDTLTALQGGH